MSQDTTARPQVPNRRAAPQDAVVAQPHDYGAPQQNDSELRGLLQGLGSFSSALDGVGAVMRHNDQVDKIKADQQAAKDAEAQGAQMGATEQRDAITGQPIPVPNAMPAGFGPEFMAGYTRAAAARTAVNIRSDIAQGWQANKNDPNFDFKSWMGEQRTKALAGIQDPHMAQAVGQHFIQIESEIAGEYEKARSARMDQSNQQNLEAITRAALAGGNTPDDIRTAAGAQEVYMGTQLTPAARTEELVRQVIMKSAALGGAPELFKAFTEAGPNGEPPLGANVPHLATHIMAAQSHAQEQRKATLVAAAEKGNMDAGKYFEENLKAGNPNKALTWDWITEHTGPTGLFKDHSQARTAYGQVLDTEAKQAKKGVAVALALQGRLHQAESAGDQNNAMDQLLGPTMQVALDAIDKGDPSSAAAAFGQILQAQSRFKSSVPWDKAVNMVQSLVGSLQPSEAPTPGFLAAAAIYKATEGNRQYRSLYFKDDVAKVMEAYTSAPAGTDPKTAYKDAYAVTDPQVKQRREEYLKSPEWAKLKTDTLTKFIGGTGFMGKVPMIGGWFRADEHPDMQLELREALGQLLDHNGKILTDKQIKNYAEDWLKSNYARDETTGQAVRIPPELSFGDLASESISAYTKVLTEAYKGKFPDDWKVQMIPTGNGAYRTVMSNGAAMDDLGQINLRSIIQWHSAKGQFNDAERAQLGAVVAAQKAGKPMPDVDQGLLGRAEVTGMLPSGVAEAYRKSRVDAITGALPQTPALGRLDDGAAPIAPRVRPGAVVDNRATATIAASYLPQPGSNYLQVEGATHRGMAKALITAGEGYAARPYQDPASGAGLNIGMGYNLNANAKTVDSDLAAAGLDGPAIQAVKSGKAYLTAEQARRLLDHVLPRYEAEAKKAADNEAPGLWSRMSPQQRAVMIDISYQVKGGASTFPKAFAALARGDREAFDRETAVRYTNQAGKVVSDDHRKGLRDALLSSTAAFRARLGLQGNLPSNSMQALAQPN